MRLARLKTKDNQTMAIPPNRFMVMENQGNVGLYFAGETKPDMGIAVDGSFDEVVAEIDAALRGDADV